MKKQAAYGNESISSLKGADRVRKRPAVIFGSDGIEGCEHSIFEILSNSIDEAREGYGSRIIVTRYEDQSVEVEDFGRGIPVDYNTKEQRFNWELLFCELYAGGKYNNDADESYEYSLGLNGLGLCSTQYASEYMDVDIRRDGVQYLLHFEKGENVGGLKKESYTKKDTGTRIRWKPDLEVFTDIHVPVEYFLDIIKRQAIVNDGVTFVFRNQVGNQFETTEFCYQNGIVDHVKRPVVWHGVQRSEQHVYTARAVVIKQRHTLFIDDFKHPRARQRHSITLHVKRRICQRLLIAAIVFAYHICHARRNIFKCHRVAAVKYAGRRQPVYTLHTVQPHRRGG